MAGRTPRAARTLIRQVRESLNRKPDSKAGQETAVAVDEPDGLGVHRTFMFDKVASKALPEGLINDPRIIAVTTDKGQVRVTFTGLRKADDASDFDLSAPEEPEEGTST